MNIFGILQLCNCKNYFYFQKNIRCQLLMSRKRAIQNHRLEVQHYFSAYFVLLFVGNPNASRLFIYTYFKHCMHLCTYIYVTQCFFYTREYLCNPTSSLTKISSHATVSHLEHGIRIVRSGRLFFAVAKTSWKKWSVGGRQLLPIRSG